MGLNSAFNPLNAELNPMCHMLALLGAHPILHVSRIRVKGVITRYFCDHKERQLVHSYTSTVKTWSGGKAPYGLYIHTYDLFTIDRVEIQCHKDVEIVII
jgi:hypothetical protein